MHLIQPEITPLESVKDLVKTHLMNVKESDERFSEGLNALLEESEVNQELEDESYHVKNARMLK